MPWWISSGWKYLRRCVNLSLYFSNLLIIHEALTQPEHFYPRRVNGFRNPMKNELKTTACLEIISSTNTNFLNLHIDKARKTHDDKQLYLITHFTKQTLTKANLFTADVKCNGTVIELPKTERSILFLNFNSCSMVATSYFGLLSTLLYTSDLKWH